VVKVAFKASRTEIDFIPGGYTCKCQPMDVGVNKPFKNGVTTAFNKWLIETGNSKPSRQDVAQWIDDAWKNVKQESIKNSWKKCGIKHKEGDETKSKIDAESYMLDDNPLE
jgi:DDE superfamily endonuclease